MRIFLSTLVLVLAIMCIFTACDLLPNIPNGKEDAITIEGGYLVVNGVKTDYQVKPDDVIEVIDDYVYVNGVKTDIFVPSCNHSWTTVTTAPTCTAGGYDTNTCSLCGKNVVENETEKLGHTYSSTYSSDDNNHWLECENCDVKKDTAIHTPDDDGVCTICQTSISATAGVIYELSDDKTYALVVGYEGTSAQIFIAKEYQGVPVTTIRRTAFVSTNITSIATPSTVTAIDGASFENCYQLESVFIPANLSSIPSELFRNCKNLKYVHIGNCLTTENSFIVSHPQSRVVVPSASGTGAIGYGAFYGCSNLSKVTIGTNITGIAQEAFSFCTGLSSVDILGDVTIIGVGAFYGCSSLLNIKIPETVYEVGFDAFAGCSESLFNEYGSCKYLGNDVSPYYFLIGTTDNNLGTYQIHEDTRVIVYSAFVSCQRLRSIVIPKNVTTIGYNVFSYTVTSVVFEDTVGWIAIAYYPNDTTFTIDPSILSDSSNAANYLHSYSEHLWRKI